MPDIRLNSVTGTKIRVDKIKEKQVETTSISDEIR
jgi:hypothetical protein